MSNSANIRWGVPHIEGTVEITYGKLGGLTVVSGQGLTDVDRFAIAGPSPGLRVTVTNTNVAEGAFATVVTVWSGSRSFSFFLRDVVNSACPIFIPELDAAVVPDGDDRGFAEIAQAVTERGLQSDFDRYEAEPEMSYTAAAARNRNAPCPTWLGVPRDARYFHLTPQAGLWGTIERAIHSVHLTSLSFEIGRGEACRVDITRWLEDGRLPVLHSIQREETMVYHLTFFATLEHDPELKEPVAGTDYATGYAHMGGMMLPAEERDAIRAGYDPETGLLLCCRIEASNPRPVPGYAWFKAPHLAGRANGYRSVCSEGLVRDSADTVPVTATARLNGRPAPQAELAVLVQPGQRAVVEYMVPHRAVSTERAAALLELDFDTVLVTVKDFWRSRLASAARVHIAEAPIAEHVDAGLLHLDLAAVGREPDGPVAATIGWYAPIGTESAPIIQYFDMMGLHKLAERAIDFFFARQREDGFIQNFGGYESETGPLLWTAGEHFRYTQDSDWLRRVAPNIRQACEYLLAWRGRNKKEEYRAAGYYGLVSGKVADPDDFYHQFFLNGGTYIGLKRAAEVLTAVDPGFAELLAGEVRDYRNDIRTAIHATLAKAPVVPLADGTWAPLPPSWPDQRSATTLYGDGGNWFTHGTFAARSVLTGAMWLAFWEVLDPDERASTFLLKVNQAPATCDNAALSQPYYSRHGAVHLARGEVKPFLRMYYNQLTALADRETHTFWEHYYGASQHKTHEEAWFLLQTRWALCREEGDTLRLFSGVPRAWLDPGKRLGIENAVTYFGQVTFMAEVNDDASEIQVGVNGAADRGPGRLLVRVPHPDGRPATDVDGPGTYEPRTETVTVVPFTGQTRLQLRFR